MKIGWFSTGRDQAAIDLLKTVQEAIRQGEIKAEIKFVFSNREIGESQITDRFLIFANHDEGLLLEAFSSKKFRPDLKVKNLEKWRREYDFEVIRRLKGFLPVDLMVLAGFMLIVSKEMCQRYKMINLHPAMPGGPTGSWQEVIWQLIESEAAETGAMMHLVTPQLDKGPAVTFCTFPIRGKPFDRYWKAIERCSLEEIKRHQGESNLLFKEIREHGLAREFPLIVATLRAFSEEGVEIDLEKRQVIDSQGLPISCYNLTEEVEGNLKGGKEDGSKSSMGY
jgi:phosphoribosylglycinamide formyltransferase-1